MEETRDGLAFVVENKDSWIFLPFLLSLSLSVQLWHSFMVLEPIQLVGET